MRTVSATSPCTSSPIFPYLSCLLAFPAAVSQLEHVRDEEVCIEMDELADKDFFHYMTQEESFRYRENWWISLKKSGKIGPVGDRSDFNYA